MKPQKVRVDFRKNRSQRTRIGDWTRKFEEHGFTEESEIANERIGGKSELSRKRTVIGQDGKLETVENLPNNRIVDNQ